MERSGGEKPLTQIVQEHLAANSVELPLFDGTASRLQQMVRSGDFDIDAVEKLIERDPGLTGPLLRLSNSSFFGGIEKVASVHDAIVRLGVQQVAELVCLASHRQYYELRKPQLKVFVERLWRHAVSCAVGCEWLAERLNLEEVRDQAFLAGLLHDVGKLLLLRVLDDLSAAGELPFDPTDALVCQVLDGLHVEQGFALMQQWNMPDAYARVVRDHEKPEADENDLLLLVVRIVNRTCNKLGIGLRGSEDPEIETSPEAHVLHVSEVLLAELEVRLEDAMELAG